MSKYGQLTSASRPLNKDWLGMVHRNHAARAAHEALFPIQGEHPEIMVLGVATLFAAVASRCNLDPQELHHMGLKVLREPAQVGGDKRTNDVLQSLKDFAGVRIMGEHDVSVA